jgi:hypothetical protein
MSNLLLNIRFGSWHFQVRRDRPWVAISHNPYHDTARSEPGWRWFQIH